MNEEEKIAKLAAKMYLFFFTQSGGYLHVDPMDPFLVDMRARCWKHAVAFYISEDKENADTERDITKS
jgi:hypothetical protein